MSSQLKFSFLRNWKLGLAVSVPCFVAGLGVSYYYYYSKKSDKTDLLVKSEPVTANKSLVENGNVAAAAAREPQKTDEVTRDPVENRTKSRAKEAEEFKNQGNTEFSRGNYQKAIEFYTKAMLICPKSDKKLMAFLYQNRAASHTKLRNYKDCIFDCDKALEFMPRFSKALSRRGRAFFEIGNIERAFEDMSTVVMLNMSPASATEMQFTNDLLSILSRKNLEEFKKQRSFDLPSSRSIEKYMGSFCYDPFNDEFARSLSNSDVNTGLEFALKCVKHKNYQSIEAACREELNKTGNNFIRITLTLNLLATISILCSNYAAGIKYLSIVIRTPEAPRKLVANSLIKRALVYYEENKMEQSFKDLEFAEKNDPYSSDVFFHRARIFFSERCIKYAIEEFKRATELSPAFILSNLQYCYIQYYHAKLTKNTVDIEKFSKKVKELLVKYPDHEECYSFYAQILSDKQAYEEVDSLLKKGSTHIPNSANLHVYRAVNEYIWNKSYSIALNHFELALKIDPKNSEAHENLAKLYTENGNLRKAMEHLEIAIPLKISERELFSVISTRNSLKAELTASERYGLTPIRVTI